MEKNNANSSAPTFLACARGSQTPARGIDNIVRHAEVSEKAIEKYLVDQTKLLGLPCLEYSNPNMVGYTDRLIVLPEGGVVWVELKSKGRKPSKVQQVRMAELTAMDHDVHVIDSKAGVDNLIEDLKFCLE